MHALFLLAASLTNTNSPLQKREKLYLLAVGYYRSGDYSRSRQLLDQCLEVCYPFFIFDAVCYPMSFAPLAHMLGTAPCKCRG